MKLNSTEACDCNTPFPQFSVSTAEPNANGDIFQYIDAPHTIY